MEGTPENHTRRPAGDVPTEDHGRGRDSFKDDVLRGLAETRKELPCKYFYDEAGSRLFDKICGLDEYYPTRTETALLGAHGSEIGDLIGPGANLIEFGCGSLLKTRVLLDSLARPALFVPIDISAEHLAAAARALAADYPDLKIVPLTADFTQPLELPPEAASGRLAAFFPGSTIGNFHPAEAARFLEAVAGIVGPGGDFLIGVDLKKDEDILVRAYDDARGVTRRFNLNLLVRVNRELDGDFDLGAFDHLALYNGDEGRIEMHLVSTKAQTVRVAGRQFRFRRGEAIHTENSYKYGADEFRAMAGEAGFDCVHTWVDDRGLFSVHALRARRA